MPAADALKQQDRWESVVEPGQLPTSFMRAAQRRQISLVFGWSSMFGSSAFASAGAEQGNSYAARRSKPLRWCGIGLAFGGSDVSAASA